jgi:hypothetical protein
MFNSALTFAAVMKKVKALPLIAKGAAESFCYFLRKKVKSKMVSSGQRPKTYSKEIHKPIK